MNNFGEHIQINESVPGTCILSDSLTREPMRSRYIFIYIYIYYVCEVFTHGKLICDIVTCTMYIVQITIYIVQITIYIVQITIYIVQFTIYASN